MLTVTNAKLNKKYELTAEMEQAVKATEMQIKAIADGMGVDVAVANAYCMTLALSEFLDNVKESNEGKSIEELLQLKEVQ